MAKNYFILLVILWSPATFVTGTSGPSGNTGQQNHIGFVGTRGKRDSMDNENEIDPNIIFDSTIQPIPSATSLERTNFMDNNNNENNRNLLTNFYSRDLPQLSIYKRTPTGFFGMRGKKEMNDQEELNSYDFWPESRTKKFFLQGLNRGSMYNNGPAPKRAPSGFMGMRGKKNSADFYGIHRKIPPEQLSNLLEESEFYDDYNLHSYEPSDWQELLDLEDKRSPTSAFVGVRGKRYPIDFELTDKRTPNGFVGMRGRRYFDSLDNPGYDGLYEKRKPSGFLGVRGKKDVSIQLKELFGENNEKSLDKRSLASFFGMRGKKQQRASGFFGTRGKKQPFEFHGKFVGVRGKKDFQSHEQSINNLEPSLHAITFNGKRTPNGFIGMRGKKDSDNNTNGNKK